MLSKDKNFTGKHCVITGGTGAIGQAIARHFVHEGASVLLTGRKNQQVGNEIATTIGAACHYLRLSVENQHDWEGVTDYFYEKKIKASIVINNAGIEYPVSALPNLQNPEDCSLSDWRSVFAVNVEGVFLGCQFAIKQMKDTGGAIVNIGSRSALVGVPVSPAYAASKAAVNNLTKSVALYCANKRYDIRCNTVHPAAIDTKMWDKELGTDDEREVRKKAFSQAIPLGRMGDADDIAKAVLYLASPSAAYITGTELVVDGGIMAGSTASADREAELSSNA